MREVAARARSGYLIALDQCADCGGIWFDRWELFPLHHAEVSRLDPVDGERLCSAVDDRRPGNCPRCGVLLREFRDVNLPADAEVARCFVCEGMWLQRGQLRRIKRRAADGEADATRAADALATAYAAEVDWSQVRDLTAAAYETEASPPRVSDLGSALRSTVPWVVLQILFRLLLRK